MIVGIAIVTTTMEAQRPIISNAEERCLRAARRAVTAMKLKEEAEEMRTGARAALKVRREKIGIDRKIEIKIKIKIGIRIGIGIEIEIEIEMNVGLQQLEGIPRRPSSPAGPPTKTLIAHNELHLI